MPTKSSDESGFSASYELSALNGDNGFGLNGIAAADNTGVAVSSAGDINGDGFADILIGADLADPNGRDSGQSYVVFGTDVVIGVPLELSSLDGSNGFVLRGAAAGEHSGYSVSAAGDVNGDGFDDLIIGAYGANANGNQSGQSYVVFGKSSFAASFELAALDGSNGFALAGAAAIDFSGFSVDVAGDVNGDGFSDLIIGAYLAGSNGSLSGKSFLVFGSDAGFDATLNLSALDGGNGFSLNGEAANDGSGYSVSGAGDINDDGLDDLIIGAWGADSNGIDSGKSYVVFGSTQAFPANVELSSLDGSNGFSLSGEKDTDFSGWSVSGAGDVNGDGIDDLIVGAFNAAPNGNSSGKAYVVYGQNGDFSANLDLSQLDGSNGYQIYGKAEGHNTGWSVSAAGDYNGDGFDDLIIGAHAADPNGSDSGQSHVIFGSQMGYQWSLDMKALDGIAGFSLNGEASGDQSGFAVKGAGDFNGDGLDDLIIGAKGADPHGEGSGKAYVLFGNIPPTLTASPANRILQETGGINNGTQGTTTAVITLTLADANGTAHYDTDYLLSTGWLDNGNNSLSKAGKYGTATLSLNPNRVQNQLQYQLDNDAPDTEALVQGQKVSDAFSIRVTDGSARATTEAVFEIKGAHDTWLRHSANINLASLDGSNGFKLVGHRNGDNTGFTVSNVGDFNGDGIDDLIVAARGKNTNDGHRGKSYLVFGSQSGFAAELPLKDLDGTDGFVLRGESNSDYASVVSDAGDINGDGFDDLIIGAIGADPNGNSSGTSYVVFGRAGEFDAAFELASLDGNNGFKIKGEAAGDRSGTAVSSAGDINGDGFADVIIAAGQLLGSNPLFHKPGLSYVVFGKAGNFTSSMELSDLDGSNGFRIQGSRNGDKAGAAVSSAGDFNGDGFDDLLIGAPKAAFTNNNTETGIAYLLMGKSSGFQPTLVLEPPNQNFGHMFLGVGNGDYAGGAISGAGDVNGDGLDDVLIGAPSADSSGNNAGTSYLVTGKQRNSGLTARLSSLGASIHGEVAGDKSGHSVSGAGDVNGDGVEDIIVGTRQAGRSYVLFGSSVGIRKNTPLADLDGSNGYAITGDQLAGYAVSGAGDVNNDGIDDLLIGAPQGLGSGPDAIGGAYVVYGNDAPTLKAGKASRTLVEAGGIQNALSGTSRSRIQLRRSDLNGIADYDLDFLQDQGWLDNGNGSFSLQGIYGTTTLNIANNRINYLLDDQDADTEQLKQGDVAWESFQVRVTDGSATTTRDMAFKIKGKNDQPSLTIQGGPIVYHKRQTVELMGLPTMVADLWPGVEGANPSEITEFQGALYFRANDGSSGAELWRYKNGSIEQVADINPGSGSSGPGQFAVYGNELYFKANDGTRGYELWKFDGVQATSVADINPGSASSSPSSLTAYNGALYFRAKTAATGRELWRYDGQSASLVADINQGSKDAAPAALYVYANTLYFAANDGNSGKELWQYDGSAVTQVADIRQGEEGSSPFNLTAYKGALYFDADDGVHGRELWRYDGTSAVLRKDIYPGAKGSIYPVGFTEYAGELFFTASTPEYGPELWAFDENVARQVTEVIPGTEGSLSGPYTEALDSLYFKAAGSTTGYELWNYQFGQVARLTDINPGVGSSAPSDLTAFDDALLFAANDGQRGKELWQYRGHQRLSGLYDSENEQTDWSGTHFTLVRLNGIKSRDQYSAQANGSLRLRGGTVSLAGTSVGSYSLQNGRFSVVFNSNATTERVHAVLSQINYTNTSNAPDPIIELGYTLTDSEGETTSGIFATLVSNPVRGTLAGDNLQGNALNEVLYGLEGSDLINAGAGKDVLYGAAGADILKGGAGDDLLFGGPGKDLLQGNAGDDLLRGGAGIDILRGGDGSDMFIFDSPADGRDKITDFTQNEDKVQVNSAKFAHIAGQDNGKGTLLAGQFRVNQRGIAKDADDFFVFSSNASTLYYDSDGNGAGSRTPLVRFGNGMSLQETDIVVS